MTAVLLLDLASDQVGPLVVASEAEDFRFLRRVVSEWEAGTNRFTGEGEALLGYFVDDRLVAICGLMRDPYQGKSTVGRLRNLYVLPEHRGRAIGTQLVRRVIELAESSFKVLRLRAGTPQAAALYERLGFTATTEVRDCTHVMSLTPRARPSAANAGASWANRWRTTMLISGACHCGNISFRLDWQPEPVEIPARACSCSFCVKHGGVWTSCPSGSLAVRVKDPRKVSTYAFGTKTAEFHVCSTCGVVPVVTSTIDGHVYAVVSVNAFEDVDASLLQRAAVSFDGEGQGDRLDRRQRNWIGDVEFCEADA